MLTNVLINTSYLTHRGIRFPDISPCCHTDHCQWTSDRWRTPSTLCGLGNCHTY